MTTHNLTRPFKRDAAGYPIPGGCEITEVKNITLTNAWQAIKSSHPCKGFMMRTRAASDFLVSLTSAGTTYYTIAGEWSMNIGLQADERLCFASVAAGSEILEILFYD